MERTPQLQLAPPPPLELLTRVLGQAVADELDAGDDVDELAWLLVVWPTGVEPAGGYVVMPAMGVELDELDGGDELLVSRVASVSIGQVAAELRRGVAVSVSEYEETTYAMESALAGVLGLDAGDVEASSWDVMIERVVALVEQNKACRRAIDRVLIQLGDACKSGPELDTLRAKQASGEYNSKAIRQMLELTERDAVAARRGAEVLAAELLEILGDP